MFKTLSLALVLGALSLAPADAQTKGPDLAAGTIAIPIWFPLPPLPPFPPTFPIPPIRPVPDAPSQHVDPQRTRRYTTDLLPYGEFTTLRDLARGLTLRKVILELGSAEDPQAALNDLKRRIGSLDHELGVLQDAIDEGELSSMLHAYALQIGLSPLPGPFVPFPLPPPPPLSDPRGD